MSNRVTIYHFPDKFVLDIPLLGGGGAGGDELGGGGTGLEVAPKIGFSGS